MQIALLHYAAPPVVGGVESVLARQAQILVQAGHQVRILAGRGKTWDPRFAVRTLPLIDSRHPEVLAAKAELDRGCLPAGFAALVEKIKAVLRPELEGVDILIAHNVASLHKNLALTAALYEYSQEPGLPHQILWHHDLAWTTPRYQAELFAGWPWDLLRSAWPGVRQVVVSEARREELAGLMTIPVHEIAVVPAGVDLAEFLKLGKDARSLAEKLDLYQADPLLLAPVRLTPRKNLALAIRILAELRKLHPAAALVITGPPGAHNPANAAYFQGLKDLRDELGLAGSAHLLAEHYPEGLPDEGIADLYRLADALLLPSREEGFGIPILEAGLLRLPIFCTGLPPLKSLAGEYAVYFSPDALPAEVANAITSRLEGDALVRMRSRVRSAYTWEAIYKQHIAPLLEFP